MVVVYWTLRVSIARESRRIWTGRGKRAHVRYVDGVGTSEAGHGNYVSLAELAAQLKVSAQTIYDLRSKGRGPRGFRVGTQLRFRESEIDDWVRRMEWADEQRHNGGAS